MNSSSGSRPRYAPTVLGLVEAEQHRAVRGVEVGVLRDEDQLLDRHRLVVLVAALGPRLGDAQAPALLEERQVRVRTAEQEDLALERVAARQHGEVLADDRVGERVHDLVARDAALHEVHDVGLGEHAALRGDVVELRRIELEARDLLARHADLQHALVDRGAGARRALVVHRRLRGLVTGLLVLLEHDDLGVLAAELDHAADVGVELLHRHRHGIDFLHELRAEVRRDRASHRSR